MSDGKRLDGERFYIVSVLREMNGMEQTDRAMGYEILRGYRFKAADGVYRNMIRECRVRKVPCRVMFEIGTLHGGEVITLFSLGNEYVGAQLKGSRMWLSVREAEVDKCKGRGENGTDN